MVTLGEKVLGIIRTNEAMSRQWGVFYGIAVGLILAENPFLDHSQVADRAFEAAHPAFADWVNSGADEIRWLESGCYEGSPFEGEPEEVA